MLQLVFNLIMAKIGLSKNEPVFMSKTFCNWAPIAQLSKTLLTALRCGKSDPNFQRCSGQLEVIPLQYNLIQNVLAQDL